MERWQKIVATAWTTALSTPILWLAFTFGTATCEDIDPCPTGGSLPFSGLALSILVGVAVLQLAFLAMIWRMPDPDASGAEAE